MAKTSPITTLLVDDHKGWRTLVRSLLQSRPDWEIVSEATDGVEAVRKATALQPDLVILDIAMPDMNGLEAAQIIHQRCPKSHIVFLTQESDPDIASAAMAIGADGFVPKMRAARELLDTIAAALCHA